MVTKLYITNLLIQSLSNFSNNTIINEFSLYRKSNGSQERDQNNNLNVLIEFANFLDSSEALLFLYSENSFIIVLLEKFDKL